MGRNCLHSSGTTGSQRFYRSNKDPTPEKRAVGLMTQTRKASHKLADFDGKRKKEAFDMNTRIPST